MEMVRTYRKDYGKKSEAHIGYIVSGEMMIRSPNGKEVKIRPGECFEIQPNHDTWVVGNEPCITLDFQNIKSIEKLK